MAALDAFRQQWDALRARRQLRESLSHRADDAGPLNSGRLVQRALAAMHAASPGYLAHFLAYVDTLAWLERMQAHGDLADDGARRVATPRKRTRARPRKRDV